MTVVKQLHPYSLLAMEILPEHLHAIGRLPTGDADFALRWPLIKSGFSRRWVKAEPLGASRQAKREPGIWQRRYWEHQIRDDIDLAWHVDYIHPKWQGATVNGKCWASQAQPNLRTD